MKKKDSFIKKYWFVIVVILAIIIKHIITINLPIYARDGTGADEYLMLCHAENLIKGNYLGPYNYLTLVKGIGFPLFLALAFKMGISYLSLYSLFYSFACLLALIPVSRVVNNKFLKLLIFLGLLYCPATLDNNVELVYRNMLIIPQSVCLVSCLMMMYFNLNEDNKKILLWSGLASFFFIFLWHTREDSIWSLPLVFMTWLVLFIGIFINKINKWKWKINRLFLISLPFIALVVSIHVISYINYRYYGVYMTNQLNQSNYTKAVMLMMKVKPKKEIERVEITRETLQRIYEVSPTFTELKEIIEYDYDNKNGLVAAHEDNGEINEDLITWELMGAANSKGYYETATKAEKYWGKVYKELKKAIDDGKLETRKTLPSRSLIPFPNKKGSFKKLVNSILSLYMTASKYKYSFIEVPISIIDYDIVRRYETITGAHAITPAKFNAKVNGCMFLKDGSLGIKIGFEDKEGNVLKSISFSDSKDVYDYFSKDKGISYMGAKKCRYSSEYDISKVENKNDVYFVARDKNNKKLVYVNVINNGDNYYSDAVQVLGNDVNFEVESDYMINRATRHIRIANYIKSIYSFGGYLYLSLIYYFILSIWLIIGLIKKKVNCFDRWLFLSAILGSATVIIIGLGYVNAFMITVNGYLASCNGLLNMFIVLSLIFMIQDLIYIFDNVILKHFSKSKNKDIKELSKILMKRDMDKLFRKKTNNTLIQFFRYLFVGGFAAVVNIGMLYVFTDVLHFYYLLSNVLAFLLGLIVNYLLSKKFVFQEKTSLSKTKEFIIYAIIGVIGLGIDTVFMWLFTDKIHFYYMVSKLVSTAIVFIWNFGARKMLYKIIK